MCGVCNGTNACVDCAGVPNGVAEMLACGCNQPDTVRALLREGASLELRHCGGETALQIAQCEGSPGLTTGLSIAGISICTLGTITFCKWKVQRKKLLDADGNASHAWKVEVSTPLRARQGSEG